eukprot:g6301.t1
MAAKIIQPEIYLYAVGGRSRGRTIGLTNRYSFRTKLWERGPTMNEPRGSLGVVLTDIGRIYSIAGSGVKSNLNSCEYLNANEPLKDQQWKLCASLEIPRHALSATFSIKSRKIYCVGGWKYGKESCATLDALEVQGNEDKEKQEGRWVSCPRLLTARKLHGVCSKNNKIYIFGGTTAGSFKPLTSAEMYDEATMKWSRIRDLPRPAQCCATTVCDEVYVILWGNPKNTGILHYSTKNDKYTKMSKLPISNWFGFAATSFGTKIYLVGGIENGKWTGAFYSFDVLTKKWEELPSLPFTRRRLSAVVYSKNVSIQENQNIGKRKLSEYNIDDDNNNSNNSKSTCSKRKKKKVETFINGRNNLQKEKFDKVALVIEYDGKQYHGFQAQDNTKDKSIQTTLEKALHMFCTIKGRVIGAGRTDSGVHAIGMVVTILVPSPMVLNDVLLKEFLQKLRSRVPKDISIRKICKVNLSFNPRKMVRCKRYTYCLSLHTPAALGRQYVWDISYWNINIELLKDAAKCFEGTHNFTLFCEKENECHDTKQKNILTISKVSVLETTSRDKKIYISFEGKSFRRKQVRKMIHAIVDVARGIKKTKDIEAQLLLQNDADNDDSIHSSSSSSLLPTNPSAPSCGLTLSWIDYGEGYSKLCMKKENNEYDRI